MRSSEREICESSPASFARIVTTARRGYRKSGHINDTSLQQHDSRGETRARGRESRLNGKIIGRNEGNRMESACATANVGRASRRPTIRACLLCEQASSPNLFGPAHRKSLPRRQLSARRHVGLARLPTRPIRNSVRRDRVIRITRVCATVGGTWASFGFDLGATSRGGEFELADFHREERIPRCVDGNNDGVPLDTHVQE